MTSTISGTGCFAFDDIDVTLNPLPVVALGNDTTLCGDSLTLSVAAVAGETYVWSVVSGSPFTQLSATSIRVVSGEYSITATNTATTCSSSDSINVTINPLPVVALGNDTTACGDSLTIGTVAQPGNQTYVWSSPSGTAFTQVGTDSIRVISGTYRLTSTISGTGCFAFDDIDVTLNPLPVVALGNDTTLCGDSLTLSVAAVAGETYVWSVVSGSPFTQLSATSIRVISGEYSITATNTATTCSSSDSISVTINPLPVVTLPADTGVCATSVLLDAGFTANASYLWSNAATTQTTTVTVSDTFTVTVTNTLTTCQTMQSIVVNLGSPVAINLGADTAACADSIQLNAGAFANVIYDWSNGGTAQTIFANASGQYSIIVTDTLTSCQSFDTINVILGNPVIVDLGPDTTFCGDSIQLDAGAFADVTYLWSNGDTTQTTFVSIDGQYSVIVRNTITACESFDTVNVIINTPPTIDIGPNTITACGDSLVLTFSPISVISTYTWQSLTGTPFNQLSVDSIRVVSGTYEITRIESGLLNCPGRDTVVVILNPDPVVSISANTSSPCADSILIEAVYQPSATTQLTWSSSVAGSFVQINDTAIRAGQSATYFAQLDNLGTGCSTTDSIDLNISPIALTVDLGADTSYCSDTIRQLDATIAGATNVTYDWRRNNIVFDSTQQITVTQSGIYFVLVTDTLTGCTATDTVDITVFAAPNPFNGSTDTVRCDNAIITLDAGVGNVYLLDTGRTGKSYDCCGLCRNLWCNSNLY